MKTNMHAFLHPVATEVQAEIYLSDRFKDEDGNVVPFVVKSINQDMNNFLIKQCTPPGRDKNGQEHPVDKKRYQSMMMVECCIQPDFKNAELCSAYGTTNPVDVPSKMLFAGEFGRLSMFIMETCGFKDNQEVLEEAKNSSMATIQSPNYVPTDSSTMESPQRTPSENQTDPLF